MLQWFLFPSTTPISFGFVDEFPMRGDFNGDGFLDIAIYSPSDRRFRYIDSVSGDEVVTDPFELPVLDGDRPLGSIQGVLGLPQF